MQLAKLQFRQLHLVNPDFSWSQLYPLFSISSITSVASWKMKEKKRSANSINAFRLKVRSWNGEFFFFFSAANSSERNVICNILAQLDSELCVLVPPEKAACLPRAPTAISHAPPEPGSTNLRCLTKNSQWHSSSSCKHKLTSRQSEPAFRPGFLTLLSSPTKK